MAADKHRKMPAAPETVSVVVPTLNEEEHLPRLLQSLRSMSHPPLEVIVADAGSDDRTRELAGEYGAALVESPGGRGAQFAAGAVSATGDVLFFAHADMLLEKDAFNRLLETLARTGAAGGCLGCRFDRTDPFLDVITWLNDVRARFFGISFGDQGQFIRREALASCGGFPPLPIMEDVELSYRMWTQGRPTFVGGGVVASARRWHRGNKPKHALLVLWLVAKYSVLRCFKGAPVDVGSFYERYYGAAGPPRDV